MKKIIIILICILSLFLSSCSKRKVLVTNSIVCMNGELYSNEDKNGIIMSAIVSFYDLEAKRDKITCYGFAYLYSCPSVVDEIVLGRDNVYEVTINDVDKSNNINCIISIPVEYYNTDIAFRPFLKYLDEDNCEKVLYSFDYNACNLYELAKKSDCEFASEIVNKVENK